MALSAVLALVGGLAATSVAVGQPGAATARDSSYLVTTGEKTALRCGAGQTWYVVAELPAGTLLRLDGESDGFFVVEYPSDLAAVVKVTEGEHKADRGMVVLTRRSSLWAFNALDPTIENCYKRVFVDQQLEPGTELAFLGTVEDRKGELAGFRVRVPSGAKGYVLPSGVRPATEEEITRVIGAPAPIAPAPVAATPSTGEGGAPGTTTMTNAGDGAAVGPTEESDTAPAVESKAKVPAHPDDALIDRLNQLEPAYQRVMRSDMERGEFIDLMESYNEIAQRASIDPTGEKVRGYADAKIALLQIRADLQEARLALQTVQSGSTEAEADLVKLARLAAEARGYAVVGRLLTSAIYDGSNLPRMFRVQSLERGTSRTIAYIIPNDDLALDSLTGRIVGVRGDSTTEATPRIPVIRAKAVDVLTLEPAQSASAPESQ